MRKKYQELSLIIIQMNLDVITSSGEGTIEDDTKDFNKNWLDD